MYMYYFINLTLLHLPDTNFIFENSCRVPHFLRIAFILLPLKKTSLCYVFSNFKLLFRAFDQQDVIDR